MLRGGVRRGRPDQRGDLAGLPRLAVHAVGHRADRHLDGVEAAPQGAEHAPRHGAVQLRDAVRPLGQSQTHVSHVEHARVVLGAEGEHARGRDAGQQRLRLRGVVEVVAHHVEREPVDAGGHGRVRGEDRARAHHGQRFVEVEPLGVLQLPDALQAQVARVSLVRVEHGGRGMTRQGAEGAHRAHPADADEDLLADPMVLVAAVEPVGDAAQVGVVLLDVGVQQEQGDPADGGPPHPRAERPPARHVHRDQQRFPGVSGEQVQRQALRVDDGVGLHLPAVERQRLAEVAGAVEQADGHERHTEVRRRLEVVAGEHAQAAGVVGQDLGDAELHREVPDGLGQGRVVLALGLVPAWFTQVGREVVGELTHGDDRLGVRRELREPGGGDLAEHSDGVVPAAFPRIGVERGEEVLRGRMPRPPQVQRKGLQRLERRGQLGADGEATQGSHGQQSTGRGQVID